MNRIWTLPLLAVVAACSQSGGNNAVATNSAVDNAPVTAPANVPDDAPPAPTQGAQASLPPGLDCIRNRLSPDQRHDVAAVAMEQASRDDPRARALLRAVDACGEEMSWSPQKRRLAGTFSLSAAGVAGVREDLGRRGIRIEQLDQTILSDRELMAAAESGRFDGTVVQGFTARHLDELQRIAGGQSLEGEVGVRIGNYLAFRALAETLTQRFAREP